jgi:GNAT superfamily N-acetyltransferase
VSAWDGVAVLAVLEPITKIYRDVFMAPPWNETDELVDRFVQRLQRKCLRPGFMAWTARDEEDMVGFATGWPTQPPFPGGRSYTAVANQFGSAWVNRWLVGAMEIDELAVLDRCRGQGVGGRLLDSCLRGAPDKGAWLLTHAHAEETVGFYRRRGWYPPPIPAPDGSGVMIFISPGHSAALGERLCGSEARRVVADRTNPTFGS